MRHFVCTFWLLSLYTIAGFGQTQLRKLPISINHPAINVSSPFISLDGNSLIYVSDNSDENTLTIFYTTKKDAVNWNEPVMMPRTVNSRLNFLRGSALTADGQQLYISSLKSGGLGGFDILISKLRGKIWSEPINPGLPINSSGHEACPSMTADGSTLYFMRCEKMDQNNAEGCKLYYSKKSRLGKWEEPIELPPFINTGNSQTPRIMGDGETLIFSSNKLSPNKGGMDLYFTKFDGKEWAPPVAMSFCNTDRDDQYVSASSFGRYLLKDQPGQRTSEIVEILFPANLKPKATMKIEGHVIGLDDLSSPYVSVFNTENQKRVFSSRPDQKGRFSLYVSEGNIYDLSVEPATDKFTFYSHVFDLTDGRAPMVERVKVPIKPVTPGIEIELDGISFEPFSSNLTVTSSQELRRVVRLIKGNTDLKFQIDVSLNAYQSDSVKTNPDLTELTIDTLHFSIEKQVPYTAKMDSLMTISNRVDSLVIQSDSTEMEALTQSDMILDSTVVYYNTIVVDSISIKKTYHNNRTEAQVNAIAQSLVREGVPAQTLILSNHISKDAAPEEKKIKVKLKIME